MGTTRKLVSRAEIARLLEIARPTVTVWQRRYADFPSPTRTGEAELFKVDELAAWLADRVIPADARQAHEPAGTTYADRLRRTLGCGQDIGRPPVHKQVEDLVERLVPEDQLRSRWYLDLVITLLLVRCRYPDQWVRLFNAAQPGTRPDSLNTAIREALDILAVTYGQLGGRWPPDSELAGRHHEIATVVSVLDGVPPTQPDEEPGDALAPVLFDRLVDRFVALEGRLATDYNTPASVVRLMTRLLAPIPAGSRIHDPYCRTGDLLAVAVAHLAGGASDAAGVTVTGRDRDPAKCRLTRMRLALIGVSAELTSGHEYRVFDPPPEPGLYDVVLTNPPFNSWGPVRRHDDFHWPFGKPPANANFAWLQYAVYLLREGGRAVIVMANNASFSSQPQEQRIRQGMIKNGAVDCVIALPSHLFTGSAIAPTLWVLRHPTGRGDDILFIDARSLGHMQSRVRRVLPDSDIEKLVNAYRTGRIASDGGAGPRMVEGISRAATLGEIRDRDYSLNPATYVDTPTATGPGVPSVEGLPDLVAELDDLESQAAEIDAKVSGLVRRLGPWTR